MEKKLNSFILSVFTIIILSFVLLPLFLCLGKFDEIHNNKVKLAESQEFVSDIDAEISRDSIILGETEDMGQDYIDRLVFLGESTTYGLQRYGVLSNGQNTHQVWTGASVSNEKVHCAGTLSLSPSITGTKIYYPETGEAITISEAIHRKNPEYLVITLGLNNGASYYTEDEFKQCYRMLLNSVIEASSEVTVILQSLFPVARTCRVLAYTPERIALCNQWILDLSNEYGINYLDTHSVLCDKDGYLLPEYDNGGDGIHLNALGLEKVIHYIRTHGCSKETNV